MVVIPAKFLHAGVVRSRIPHAKVATPMKRAEGSFWRALSGWVSGDEVADVEDE